jgi:uncharacterized protein (TIGR02246 family)
MIRVFSLITVAGSLLLFAGAAAAQTSGRSEDDAAIRQLVKHYVDAREQGNSKAVDALFTKDADQLTSSGDWRRGRDEVVRGSLASSKQNAGRRTITVEAVRFVSGDVAIADGRYEIAGTAAATRSMWTTFVMARGADGWRIAAIRNMLPAAPASSSPSR